MQNILKNKKERKMTGLLGSLATSTEIGLIFGILAMGYMLSYKILEYYDLSLEGSYPMGAFLTAVIIAKGLNPYLGLVLSSIGGGLAGFLTYILYKKSKSNPPNRNPYPNHPLFPKFKDRRGKQHSNCPISIHFWKSS